MKKALIDVSTSLQDKTPTPLNRPIGGSSSGASPDEFFPNLSTLLPALPGKNSYWNGNTWSPDAVSAQEMNDKQEVIFRMLCSNNAAGYVIGKKRNYSQSNAERSWRFYNVCSSFNRVP